MSNIATYKLEEQGNELATKEDVAALMARLIKEMADLRLEMRANTREMIKWMFIFWIGQIGATLAIVLLFLKK